MNAALYGRRTDLENGNMDLGKYKVKGRIGKSLQILEMPPSNMIANRLPSILRGCQKGNDILEHLDVDHLAAGTRHRDV